MADALGYVAVDGYRLWRDYRDCNHSNANACGVCDHDRYYATKYEVCPWREEKD